MVYNLDLPYPPTHPEINSKKIDVFLAKQRSFTLEMIFHNGGEFYLRYHSSQQHIFSDKVMQFHHTVKASLQRYDII